ncbi:MAG TPA: SOS response-associated peptidase family protein, partial [Bacteroidales bacterium]
GEGDPYVVFARDKKRPFALGCVWDAWKKDILDPLTYGFAIATTPAYGEFARVGIERMPLIIEGKDYRNWVKKDLWFGTVTDMLHYYDQKLFNAYPIDKEILKSLENERSLITPKGELV